MYHGDIRLGDTIDIKFTSRTFTTGAPGTLSSSPVISAYPGNSTTEVTGGITLSVDFDGRTGLNNCRVVATSGNGYATATNYTLVITTGTVGGVSVVGECIGSFSIECRSALMPATAARTLVVDASGLADANAVKVGPTGSGTAQTARDIGASVLLSAGSGTGQLDFTSGVVKANATQWLGGTIPAVNVTGVPLVDLKYTLGTISPATAGSVRADAVTGAVGSVTGAVGSVTARVTANTDQLAGQTVTAAAGVTFPTSVASPTNITAGTITTATNLTNAPTAGDFTATMKTSIGTAVAASAVASVTGAVGSVTGLTASDVGAIKAKTDNLPASPAAVSDIPSAASNAAAVLAATVEGSITVVKMLRGFGSALLGKASGLATTTAVYRNASDSKDVITATVDSDGDRSAVTLDLT
jgi:hypothetical protein